MHLRPPVSDGGSFVAGHFTAPRIHEQEIARFCQTLDRALPTLVVGDFNEEEDGRAIAYLARAEWGMRSALPEFAPDRPTWRWPTSVGTLERRLDHIAYDVRLEPLSVEVIEAGRSDHLPVVGVFVSAARGRASPRHDRPRGLGAPLALAFARGRLAARDRLVDHLAPLARLAVGGARRLVGGDRPRQRARPMARERLGRRSDLTPRAAPRTAAAPARRRAPFRRRRRSRRAAASAARAPASRGRQPRLLRLSFPSGSRRRRRPPARRDAPRRGARRQRIQGVPGPPRNRPVTRH